MVIAEVGRMEHVQADARAFEAIFARYQQPIYNYVLRLMGNPEDALDLTQDTFLKAFAALPRMPADLNISPWLYRIATNCCLDELRRRRLIHWQPIQDFLAIFHPKQVDSSDPEGETIRREDARLVREILTRLPPRYRICLLLREYQDLSCEEIGQVLGCSRGAVKSLLFRAREEFRTIYQTMAKRPAEVPVP